MCVIYTLISISGLNKVFKESREENLVGSLETCLPSCFGK